MKVQLVGMRALDFTNKDTKERVVGTTLQVVSDVVQDDPNVVGCLVKGVFTRLNVSDLTIGGIIDLVYEVSFASDRAKLVKIVPVDAAAAPKR